MILNKEIPIEKLRLKIGSRNFLRKKYIAKAIKVYDYTSPILWFWCSIPGCKNIIRGYTEKRICYKCSHKLLRKKSYEGLYNAFISRAKHPVKITYEEFKNICKNKKECEYCGEPIKRAKFRSSAPTRNAYLDRKNNSKPYEFKNCVSCCARCNDMKGQYLTYNEMKLIWKNRGVT